MMPRDSTSKGKGPSAAPGRGFAPLIVSIAALAILKLVLIAATGPFMDEAYYWMWGQHPELSYFDHPPLNAWLQGLASLLFGWNLLALRIVPVLTTLADIFILYLFSRRLVPSAWQRHFLVTVTLFLSTPIFFAMTALALPDHTMIVTGLAALYCFHVYFEDYAAGRDRGPARLYLGALFLGLSVLSKYNGAFFGIGLALYIVLTPRLRGLVRSPHLWAAAALSLALQAPVIAWNLTERFASYGYVLKGRHHGLAEVSVGVIGFVLGALVFLSPLLVAPMLRLVLGARREPRVGLPTAIFWVSTLSFLTLSFTTTVLFHWNLAAYVAVLPFLALVIRRMWVVYAQVLFGILFLLGLIFNFTILPVMAISGPGDEASAWVHDWHKTALAVAADKAEYRAGFVAGSDYTVASLLGFAMRDKNVTSLSPQADAFDYWWDGKAHAGEDAIVVADSWRTLTDSIRARFGSVELLAEIPVVRFGRTLDTHQIYLARGYIPPDGTP